MLQAWLDASNRLVVEETPRSSSHLLVAQIKKLGPGEGALHRQGDRRFDLLLGRGGSAQGFLLPTVMYILSSGSQANSLF